MVPKVSNLIYYIAHHAVRKYHAIVNDCAHDGVSVSQDAGDTGEFNIDTSGTMYASGAAGNGDGG